MNVLPMLIPVTSTAPVVPITKDRLTALAILDSLEMDITAKVELYGAYPIMN